MGSATAVCFLGAIGLHIECEISSTKAIRNNAGQHGMC